ncbi:MAG TPA: hypothetical protein VK906_00345 [Egicoccus sp.]|nr:hypothetical protein [Egicoccus sp.]HSK21589.1 hypothetical protein [Egicoccus sp.]
MTAVRLTIDSDDRRSRRVVETISDLVPTAEVRDARYDADAADFLDRLVCCGSVTPVLEVGGLLLTAPTPAEAVLAVRRAAPELVV